MSKQVKQSNKVFWHFVHRGSLVSVRASNRVSALREFRRLVFPIERIRYDIFNTEDE